MPLFRQKNKPISELRNSKIVPIESKRNTKSKLRILWRALTKASKIRFVRQKSKLPRSISGLSKRSEKPRKKLLKPLQKLRS